MTGEKIFKHVPDVILGILAVAGLVISGWSLATLLHGTAGAPWWVACFGVAVFDLVAMASAVLVYQRRDDPWQAGGSRLVMTLSLLASSVVNGHHGMTLGGWPTAAVLAAAPLSFEVAFELRHRTLTAMIWILFWGEAWEALSKDAEGRLTTDETPKTPAVEPSQTTHTVEQVREPERALSLVPSQPTHAPSQAVETATHEGETDTGRLLTLLKGGETLSAQKAAELLGVSRATGGRRLAEAKAALRLV